MRLQNKQIIIYFLSLMPLLTQKTQRLVKILDFPQDHREYVFGKILKRSGQCVWGCKRLYPNLIERICPTCFCLILKCLMIILTEEICKDANTFLEYYSCRFGKAHPKILALLSMWTVQINQNLFHLVLSLYSKVLSYLPSKDVVVLFKSYLSWRRHRVIYSEVFLRCTPGWE